MAEIVLITGVPGTGKTAKVVSMMAAEEGVFAADENGIKRKVFTNINGLQLPHTRVETDPDKYPQSTDDVLSFHDCYKWIQRSEYYGSILIIDEAQDVWPTRTGGGKLPPNIAWLNTHRHLGIDIFVLTQNPKNLDLNLRGLVKKHWHVAVNKLGLRSLLEWKYCATNPITQAKDAFVSIYKVDESIFGLYKSAEIHTENKTKRSKWIYVLPIALLLLPIMIFVSYKMLKGGTPEKVIANTEQSASSPHISAAYPDDNNYGSNGNLTPEMFVPTLAERPESKPIYNGIRQVRSMERIAGCVGSADSCSCYTDQATRIREIPETLCREYVKDGLPFDPFRERRDVATAPSPEHTAGN